MDQLSAAERATLRRLNTPRKLQDFLERLRYNRGPRSGTLHSPRVVLREGRAHCIEGALLAAAALWVNGARPLLLDVRSTDDDLDHVVALFRRHGCGGAISKTNHAVLRYREPVYRTVRELALSFFHEYFLNSGRKTMRDFSAPYDVVRHHGTAWLTREDDLWDIAEALDRSPHSRIMIPAQVRELRRADPVEIRAGKLVTWRR